MYHPLPNPLHVLPTGQPTRRAFGVVFECNELSFTQTGRRRRTYRVIRYMYYYEHTRTHTRARVRVNQVRRIG
jgi:hypothetical protein